MNSFFKKVFSKTKLSPDITALYSNIVIDQIGEGLVGLFMPIFLWQTFGSINLVLLYYFCVYFLYAVLVFFGAKIMSRLGQKMSMILSIPFKILFFTGLYFLSVGYPVLIITFLMITIVEVRLMLFWVPYHTDFAGFTNKKSRGRVIGLLSALSSLVSILIPVFSGWLIKMYGFEVLFLIAIVLFVVSLLPLFLIKPTFEKFTFSFKETWRKLLGRQYRRMFLSYFADGMENMVGAIIWPIFIFQLLKGDFLAVGAISSLIVLFTVSAQLIMGQFTDKFDKKKLMRWGSGLYAIGWFLKIFVSTGFEIFLASTYHNFAAIVMRTPFDALIYEKAADAGHYVDELTVLREMALNLGRAFCVILLFIFLSFFGLQWTFILAGVASLFVNIL